jgi:hypothetical protein
MSPTELDPGVYRTVLFKPGADPGFQVRGGGALKKIAPSGGRRENFWGITCEKSRFYAKKSYFFPIAEGRGHVSEIKYALLLHIKKKQCDMASREKNFQERFSYP